MTISDDARRAAGLGSGMPSRDGWHGIEQAERDKLRVLAEGAALDEAHRRAKTREATEEQQRVEARETERAARTTAAAEALKERLLARYLETPGATHAGFTAMWPRLLADHQLHETLHGEDLVEQTRRELAVILRGAH